MFVLQFCQDRINTWHVSMFHQISSTYVQLRKWLKIAVGTQIVYYFMYTFFHILFQLVLTGYQGNIGPTYNAWRPVLIVINQTINCLFVTKIIFVFNVPACF